MHVLGQSAEPHSVPCQVVETSSARWLIGLNAIRTLGQDRLYRPLTEVIIRAYSYVQVESLPVLEEGSVHYRLHRSNSSTPTYGY